MKVNQYDIVKLVDGRTGVAVEVFDNEVLVDIGHGPSDWSTISVSPEDIESIMNETTN